MFLQVKRTALQPRPSTSSEGNAYYTFDLSDGALALRVFSFGTLPCRSGAATVEGTFLKVKRQGP